MPRSRKEYERARRYYQATESRKAASGMKTDYGAPKQDVTPYRAEEDVQGNRRGARELYRLQRGTKRMRRNTR